MSMQSIQSKLDEVTREKAQADYTAAVRQARKLLEPFFAPYKFTTYRDGVADLQAQLTTFARMTRYGDLCIGDGDNSKVPEAYVLYMQEQASQEFIEKVDKLQDQIDELYGTVENLPN